tara:strand:- start:100 stop:399 length:300 start_codon:yes stop_codon:yes gene_type:complete
METNRKYFIVHGQAACPFCVQALGVLEGKNINYIFSPLRGELLSEVKQRWNHKTVPIVVERDLHNTEYERLIGGCDDLQTYLNPEPVDGGASVLDNNCD